ncbi:SHOCT domain-containing protein [Leucobacter allii]|uniref:SHOCT domain-containing protein n=1 Tax=Leucobacter allii TaxID=2932247 RepID=A0ABY4FNG6_9MICO|nr:SHOCT domain-containing protein [Leucobacter allii]UOQ57829.1 SHOCT domain-containing protein [Leucobacter allii]
MPLVPRRGRPGLLGLAARAAVVAGTATTVTRGIAAHQRKTARAPFEAAQYEAAQQQMAPKPEQAQAVPAAPCGERMTEFRKLGDLKTQGVLSDAEFETAKARLLQ